MCRGLLAAVALVAAAAVLAQTAAPDNLPFTPGKLPFMSLAGPGGDLYPTQARDRKENGAVDLEFSIDQAGRVTDIKELFASSPEFGTHGLEMLRNAVLVVPEKWSEEEHRDRRYTLELQYSIKPVGMVCDAAPPRIPGATVVRICVRYDKEGEDSGIYYPIPPQRIPPPRN
jgi:TonB family protein